MGGHDPHPKLGIHLPLSDGGCRRNSIEIALRLELVRVWRLLPFLLQVLSPEPSQRCLGFLFGSQLLWQIPPELPKLPSLRNWVFASNDFQQQAFPSIRRFSIHQSPRVRWQRYYDLLLLRRLVHIASCLLSKHKLNEAFPLIQVFQRRRMECRYRLSRYSRQASIYFRFR